MEELINKVIEIDKKASEIILKEEEKNKNLENYIEEEIKKKQDKIETEMKKIIYEKQKEYDYELKKKKQDLTDKLSIKLQIMRQNYEKQKKLSLENAFNNIVNMKGNDMIV